MRLTTYALTTGLALAAIGSSPASTWFVRPGAAPGGDGTRQRPFSSITLALTRAAPAGLGKSGSAEALIHLAPGVYVENITIDGKTGGNADIPIRITSSPASRAVVKAPPADGLGRAGARPAQGAVSVYNRGNVTFENIRFVGNGVDADGSHGVSFWADNGRYGPVKVLNCEVTQFGKWGMFVGGGGGSGHGFRDVLVEDCEFHMNREGGMNTWGESIDANQNVIVRSSRFYDHPGDPALTKNSGNGLVLGMVDGGLVDYCECYNNGYRCSADEGAAGLWCYDANALVFQYNESHHNKTASGVDGDGFDLDQNVSNSIIQYNYSHDNDGAGYLISHGPDNANNTGNVIRYNISENDCRKLKLYGGIHVYGRTRNTHIYNNTVYVSPSGGEPVGIIVCNWTIESHDVDGLYFRNNAVYATGNCPLVYVTSGQTDGARDLVFQGNSYYGENGFVAHWGGTSYAGLSAWRNATGQEMLNSEPVGSDADPKFTDPGGGGTLGDPTQAATLSAYAPGAGSPLIDAGLDLAALFGTTMGDTDLAGTTIPQNGTYDIGALEYVIGTSGPWKMPPPSETTMKKARRNGNVSAYTLDGRRMRLFNVRSPQVMVGSRMHGMILAAGGGNGAL